MLSERSRDALAQCYAGRVANTRDSCSRAVLIRVHLPLPHEQGAMLVVNPYRASVASALFMSADQRAIRDEVIAHFDAMPKAYRIMAERNREALEALGVW